VPSELRGPDAGVRRRAAFRQPRRAAVGLLWQPRAGRPGLLCRAVRRARLAGAAWLRRRRRSWRRVFGGRLMKFAATIEYLQDKARVERSRPAHRQYLLSLRDRGQLAASGPFTDGSGALIIYEAATREEAEKLMQGDPFHQNGIFVRWDLR